MKSTLRITDEDLGKYYIIFFDAETNESFCKRFLYSLTTRERDNLLGYNPRVKVGSSECAMKKGRYPALRIKIMYRNSNGKINPNEIRSNFDNQVLRRHGNLWMPIDEKSKNAVWDAICDEL